MAVETDNAVTPARLTIAIVIGVIAGFLVVLVPYGMVWLTGVLTLGQHMPPTAVSGFISSLTMLFPIVQGFAMAVALGGRTYSVFKLSLYTLLLCGVQLLGAFVLLREGVICLIILAPLIYVCMLVGALLGMVVARRFTAGPALHASLIPLAMLVVFAEATGPKPEYTAAVTDSVVVNAPPEYVWRYVLSYPENTSAPEYWLWNAGLPHPTQSVASAPEIGATRECRFSTGIAFEERIVELVPNEVMTFNVTRQPDHPEVIGHFQFDRGQVRLTRNPDGTTTITATSWYRLFVRPAAYFNWWTEDITRQVHFRVLNHMKRLAEADYATASAP